ncbi:MAG TPA: tetraacyldisaccharide 4'-kinase [Pirellulales bacterium]
MILSPAEFRAIVSGRRRGASGALARCLLASVEVPYTLAVRWRNYGYDRGYTPATRVAVPVISVGNLSMGGTGKTPLVAWIAGHLQQRGMQVTLVSRGYGAAAGEQNDEALELAQKLPGVPHLQNPDRVAAAQQAIAELGAQTILLDDGFQHRRLARDLDIVLLDAVEPFGFEHVFPRGTLREPLSGLRRADVIALSRADMVDAAERARIRAIALGYAPQAAWIEMRHAPVRLRGSGGSEASLASLVGQPLAAFCGIGNPAGFRHTLVECGYNVLELREFPDHHAYSAADATALSAWAKQLGAGALVCTHKDLVKLASYDFGPLAAWAVEIGLEITVGEEQFTARLDQLPLAATK